MLVEAAELKTSRIRAMWTAISSPLIRSLFKSTWFGDFHNHVDWNELNTMVCWVEN
jgi:hypothetical protein